MEKETGILLFTVWTESSIYSSWNSSILVRMQSFAAYELWMASDTGNDLYIALQWHHPSDLWKIKRILLSESKNSGILSFEKS